MTRRMAGASPAFRFVLAMGVVNLFADATYEGGGSINGPFLGSLGASAATISIIAGAGEFLGYGVRAVSGYIADRTGRRWLITFIGYAINLLAVPAMALAGRWEAAAALIWAERIGRAIRKPTVEAMLSYTTAELGKGKVYALNTALDETGATIGPLIAALILYLKGDARTAYAFLLIPAVLALVSLGVARIGFPLPARPGQAKASGAQPFSKAYWLYTAAGALFAAGLTSFELISFHLTSRSLVGAAWVPALLAFATACGVAANLVLGRLYDRLDVRMIVAGVALSAAFAPLVFLGGLPLVIAGMVLWAIGYAVQDTLLKAVVAGVMPEGRRNFAFGLFYAVYGGGWLIGSIVTGLLYERSRVALAAFAGLVQLVSIPVFVIARRAQNRRI